MAQAKTFEVHVSNDNRWTVAEVCTSQDDGVRVAESLLAAGKCDGVRVLHDRGDNRTPKVIFEKAGAGKKEKPITISAIEDAPLCQATIDMFGFDARLAGARLMRQFLDEYGITALELLCDFGRLRQIVRNDVLYPQALHRVAGIQARKIPDGKPAERVDVLHRIVTDLVERARDNAEATRFHAVLAEQGMAAMIAEVDKTHKGERAVYLKGAALARLLSDSSDWEGKIALLCGEIERGPQGEALTLLDDVLAEILDGSAAIQALFGSQADMATALRNLAQLSYGACTAKGGRSGVLPRLNAVMGRARLIRTRQILVGRVERALRGVGPLTREDQRADRDAFAGLVKLLISPAGLLGGPGMCEAVTLRARLNLGGAEGDLSPEEAIRGLLMFQPTGAVKLGYLLDLARSPFGRKNPVMMGKMLTGLLAELSSPTDLFPSNWPPERQKAIVADLRRRAESDAIAEDLRAQIVQRLDRLLAGETVATQKPAAPAPVAAAPAPVAGTVRIDGQDMIKRELAAGEYLFRQGDQGDEAYLIMSGDIEILIGAAGAERLLSVVHRGDIIGEMALLAHQPRMASARAKGPALLVAVPAEAFQARLDRLGETDRILRRLLDVFAERIRAASGN